MKMMKAPIVSVCAALVVSLVAGAAAQSLCPGSIGKSSAWTSEN
jgi:hypothetical protein